MSNESSNELVVKSAPHIHGTMTKNRMMQYTFFAILAVTIVSAALWSQVTTPSGWNLGETVAIGALIAVGLAVLVDLLIGKVSSDSEVNTWSAAVFGLIVINCFTLGFPSMAVGLETGVPVEAPLAFYYIAIISLLGIVVFKKVMSLAGRKLVNPAAAAKFLVLIPTLPTTLITAFHLSTGVLKVPALTGGIGATSIVMHNGAASFGTYLQSCYGLPAAKSPARHRITYVPGKIPRMGRRSKQHRSYHRGHRTLRNWTQILQMENYRQLPHRHRCVIVDILIHIRRRRLNHKTILRAIHRQLNIHGVLHGNRSGNHTI